METVLKNYDYKKIVEEFEKWLKEHYCNKEARGPIHFSEREEVQDKFLVIKRKHMILHMTGTKRIKD